MIKNSIIAVALLLTVFTGKVNSAPDCDPTPSIPWTEYIYAIRLKCPGSTAICDMQVKYSYREIPDLNATEGFRRELYINEILPKIMKYFMQNI